MLAKASNGRAVEPKSNFARDTDASGDDSRGELANKVERHSQEQSAEMDALKAQVRSSEALLTAMMEKMNMLADQVQTSSRKHDENGVLNVSKTPAVATLRASHRSTDGQHNSTTVDIDFDDAADDDDSDTGTTLLDVPSTATTALKSEEQSNSKPLDFIGVADGPTETTSDTTFERFARSVFRRADADCDNLLSPSEFQYVLSAGISGIKLSDNDEGVALFMRANTDASGKLSFQQFLPVFRSLLQRAYQGSGQDAWVHVGFTSSSADAQPVYFNWQTGEMTEMTRLTRCKAMRF